MYQRKESKHLKSFKKRNVISKRGKKHKIVSSRQKADSQILESIQELNFEKDGVIEEDEEENKEAQDYNKHKWNKIWKECRSFLPTRKRQMCNNYK